VLLTCPNCRSGLEVPEGTTAYVRCPACQNVFAPPEPEPEPEPPATLRLACPTCRSVLEVPGGTTALVRCPACQTVFSPADNVAPPEPEPPPRPKKKPKRVYRTEEDDDEDEDRKDEGKEKHRDFVPMDGDEDEDGRPKKKRRPRVPDDELTPQEKINRRAAFDRAAWGSRLIMISLALYLLSMIIVTGFFFQGAFGSPQGWIVTVAGFMGLVNWVLAAVGVALCLSGPQAPGHWEFGGAALAAVLVHGVMLAGVVSQGKEIGVTGADEVHGFTRWHMLPTRLNATMYYLVAITYPDEQGVTPRGRMRLSMFVGMAEMVRTVMIMIFLSCMARAALDDELAARCTRTAGVASGGPGLLALLFFFFFAFIIETNATINLFTKILASVVHMGVFSIVTGTLMPAFLASQDVVDACEEPFQSLIPQL
jgi:LSD1 subclass zinc finger protein